MSTNRQKSKNKKIPPSRTYYYKAVIGADEVGVGEMFMPQVFVACYVTRAQIPKLEAMGVKDSKKISKKKCCDLAKKLIKMIPYSCSIVSNEKLNKLYINGTKNITVVEVHTHEKVIDKLYQQHKKAKHVILDEFCTKEIFNKYSTKNNFVDGKLISMPRGESEHLAVACASIIATYFEELEIKRLTKELGLEVPKGNSDKANALAKKIKKKYGVEGLQKYAKLSNGYIKALLAV